MFQKKREKEKERKKEIHEKTREKKERERKNSEKKKGGKSKKKKIRRAVSSTLHKTTRFCRKNIHSIFINVWQTIQDGQIS